MRVDKFLKVARLIKRRSVAKEIADQGRVDINGKVAKSSSVVKTGDELTIRFGNKTMKIRIERILETTKKDESTELYTILDETYPQAD
ncbi:RNA-binding S4 domain-containing protein [Weissella halotolerans]|uniref:RQC P-site tRNA stabilizing factor n=1 Tax=Weissella halotolerans DSM 20190 TaxID=1123500 RepID=A0A0R2FPZ5_9LACO|nr:RNA-binding S4 domain-containing protein [Weissella halotolerans]KRN30504.1 hypothetical protein IV68_GL001330 [Weissella halotolerans DSM 20190]